MHNTNTFWNDLVIAQQVENEVADIFISKGYSVSGSPSDEYFPAYDMAISQCPTCMVYTIEVKYDIKSDTTGNVAIEQYKLDFAGKVVDSGLSITKADAWVIKAANQFYRITVKKLRQLLIDNYGCYAQIISDDNKALALLPIDFIKNHFKIFQ